MKYFRISKHLKITFYGILMGTANKIPGVSGGLVAIAIGFYNELLDSLNKFDNKALKKLIGLKVSDFYNYVNGSFLFFIFFGIIISYFSTSKLLDILIKNYELYVWSLFFGLVIGTIFHLRDLIKFDEWRNIIMIFLGISFGLILSFLDPAKENDNLFFVFVCGMISVVGMIIPGLSGSFLLMLMGNYVLLLVDSVNALYDSIMDLIYLDFSNFESDVRMNYIKIIIVFSLGSLTGLISLSKLLRYLLNKYAQLSNSLIFGFIIGSLGVIWPWKIRFNLEGGEKILRYFPEPSYELIYAIFFILLGLTTVIILSRYEKK